MNKKQLVWLFLFIIAFLFLDDALAGHTDIVLREALTFGYAIVCVVIIYSFRTRPTHTP